MKLALIQMNSKWESIPANCNTASQFIKRASSEKCDAVIFPEMFNTGFSMNTKITAEKKQGMTHKTLSAMAKKHRINIIAGLAVKTSAKKALNSALVYDRKGSLIASYVKIHPFTYAEEDRYFSPGRKPVIFKLDKIMCSIFICYDLRFPESFRLAAKKSDLIFVIANWPSERKAHWKALLKARAIENLCFITGVNRTGTDGNGIQYSGMSLVFDPLGKCLFTGNAHDEYQTCEIDPAKTQIIRKKLPFLNDI